MNDLWPETPVNEAQPPCPNFPFATIFSATEKPSTTQEELLITREDVRNETQKSKFPLYNASLKKKGEREFEKRWNNRAWVDDWRRSDREEDVTTDEDDIVVVEPKTQAEIDAYLKKKGVPRSDQELASAKTEIGEAIYKAAEHYREDLGRTDKALELIEEVDAVISIEVPDEKIVGRICGRYSCGGCGAVYHDTFNPSAKQGVCDSCSSTQLKRRADDNEETVRSRLEAYHSQTAPLAKWYDERGKLVIVDGDKEIAEVGKDILSGMLGIRD